MARFESGGASRLEPLVQFITDSRQARCTADSENLADLRKWHHLVGSNLLFSSEVMESEGMSMSETVTAHARLRDASARQAERMGSQSEDESRGGSAARSPRRQDFGGQASLSPDNGKREGSQESQQNRAFSSRPRASRGRAAEVESAFIPILPADIAAGQSPDSVFHFLGSKTDPILHVQYPRPWNHVADFVAKRGEISGNSVWRRVRDSNPRIPCGIT